MGGSPAFAWAKTSIGTGESAFLSWNKFFARMRVLMSAEGQDGGNLVVCTF